MAVKSAFTPKEEGRGHCGRFMNNVFYCEIVMHLSVWRTMAECSVLLMQQVELSKDKMNYDWKVIET